MTRPLFATLGTILCLGGCAQPPTTPVASVPVTSITAAPRLSGAEQLLAYVVQVKAMPPAQLLDEHNRLRDSFQRDRRDLNRVKLAVVQLHGGVTDDNDTAALIEPLLAPGTDGAARAVALLMNAVLQERRKARDNMAGAQARLKETQKGQDQLQQRNDQLRRQMEELEARLAGLKSIEKSLIERR